jgi:DNA polymerase-3 subunit gamma/tau
MIVVMSLALYRKYRPKKLADLLGHETNVQILKNAASQDRIGQAYLFYGPRGTGKTTTARLLAKLLNCEKRKADPKFRTLGEPCNECRACAEIDALNSLDVIEIDAASNRGIDEIRNLKENIATAPSSSDYKVYIIDEAHMLTGPAFNALLKTLEEPPKHAVFVLATTEFEKLPPTIVSRTQRFLFKKISKIKMLEKLGGMAKAEKINIEPAALDLIAAAAEGSLRDAESLLDQISSIGGKIEIKNVEQLIGRVGLQKIEQLSSFVLAGDIENTLKSLSETYEEGINLVQFTKDLIHYFRRILSLHMNPELAPIFEEDFTKDELATLKKLAVSASPAKQIPLIKSLIRAYAEMRYSPFAMVPLEIALIENVGQLKSSQK